MSQMPTEHEETEPDVRFSLANERTLLAYQRTAIGLIGASVAVAHFLDDGALAITLASVLLLSGAVAAVGGYRRYQAADRAIRAGRPLPTGTTALILSVGLIICVLVAGVYVITAAT
ncbi:MAG: conserved transrane protein [Marmoricola sp.]|nr:conserved transrane protein [Marmoricola sp.]